MDIDSKEGKSKSNITHSYTSHDQLLISPERMVSEINSLQTVTVPNLELLLCLTQRSFISCFPRLHKQQAVAVEDGDGGNERSAMRTDDESLEIRQVGNTEISESTISRVHLVNDQIHNAKRYPSKRL